jgi:hypothetical protein
MILSRWSVLIHGITKKDKKRIENENKEKHKFEIYTRWRRFANIMLTRDNQKHLIITGKLGQLINKYVAFRAK